MSNYLCPVCDRRYYDPVMCGGGGTKDGQYIQVHEPTRCVYRKKPENKMNKAKRERRRRRRLREQQEV